MSDNFHVHNLEVHQTKDIKTENINGELTIIWRDWDKIINQPQMIYLNLINPHEIKGPHLHKKRKSTRISHTSEVLLIMKGVIRVDFYNSSKNYLFFRFSTK